MCSRALPLVVLLGCVVPEVPRRCEVGPGGCETVSLVDFEFTATCDDDGPLSVLIGDGERAFAPVRDLAEIDLHSGRQGGEHMFVGVRVGNLELDKYDEVHVELALWSECGADDCWSARGGFVLGREEALDVVDDTTVQAVGVFIFFNGETRLRAVATDRCGRRGQAIVD